MSPAFGIRQATWSTTAIVKFQVVEEDLTPLLSTRAAEKINLTTVNYSNFK